MRMKAAIYYEPRNIRVEEVERLAPGDTGVIVKVGAYGVCPILDLDAWLRRSPERVGVALGYE